MLTLPRHANWINFGFTRCRPKSSKDPFFVFHVWKSQQPFFTFAALPWHANSFTGLQCFKKKNDLYAKCCVEEENTLTMPSGQRRKDRSSLKKRSNVAAVVVIVASFAFAFECGEGSKERKGQPSLPHTVKINIFARFGYSQNLCKFFTAWHKGSCNSFFAKLNWIRCERVRLCLISRQRS